VRSEVLRAVSWQACAAAAVGIVAGVPLGVVLGRVAWLTAVRDLGMIDPPSIPWLVGALVVAIALTGAAMLGAVSGWFVARRRPAEVLRTE
jgi:hypothetical protein